MFGPRNLDFSQFGQDFALFLGELLIEQTSRAETWYENIYELLPSLGTYSALPVLESGPRILYFRVIMQVFVMNFS